MDSSNSQDSSGTDSSEDEDDVVVDTRQSVNPNVVSRELIAVLPKHTLFKVSYFILAKFNNYTIFILFSVKYFKKNFSIG